MAWRLHKDPDGALVVSLTGGLSRYESDDAARQVALALEREAGRLVIDARALEDYDPACREVWQARLLPVRQRIRRVIFRGRGSLPRWDAMLAAVFLRVPYEFQTAPAGPLASVGVSA